MNDQIKTTGTKREYEDIVVGIYGYENLHSSPYWETPAEPNAPPIRLTLYYYNDVHIGTWQKGKNACCWYYPK